MTWDLGLRGFALLVVMALVGGVIIHLVWRRRPAWLWLAATASLMLLGLMASEVWFGWATEEELQPNIDGLSFDETLLAIVMSVLAAAVAHLVVRRRHPA